MRISDWSSDVCSSDLRSIFDTKPCTQRDEFRQRNAIGQVRADRVGVETRRIADHAFRLAIEGRDRLADAVFREIRIGPRQIDRARVDVVLRLQVDAIAGTEEVGMRDLNRDQEALRPRITDTELHAARRTFLDLEAELPLNVGAQKRKS